MDESAPAERNDRRDSLLSRIARNITDEDRARLQRIRESLPDGSGSLGGVITAEAQRRARSAELLMKALPLSEHDTLPVRTAENTARAATAAERQAEAVDELVKLTEANLAISNAQRESAALSERFTRRTSFWSLLIAAASFFAAVAALWVSIVK